MERAPRREERTGETRTPAERGSEMCKHDGLTYGQFLEAAKAAMPDFNVAKLNSGKYSNEQMDAIEASVARKREAVAAAARPRPTETAPRPASAPAPAPRSAEGGRRGTEAAPTTSAGDGRRGRAAIRTGAAFLAGATLMGAGIGAAHLVENAGAVQPAEAQEENQNEADEMAEAQEDGESFDISDNYRGRYADETGNYTNPNKIGRNGQEAPYNFGEAYEYTDAEAFKDEIEQVAMHEPAIFSSWYYDLDDSMKVPGTEKMSMSELQHAMMENEDLHRQMVEKFISIADSASYEESTITGRYTNVFARTSGGGGTEITSQNTEAVHCETQENGSKVVVMTYEIGKDQTAQIIFREACGLQNVRLVGTPESDKIITTTPEIPTPEPEKPTPEPDKPTPTPDEPGGGDEDPTPEPDKPTPEPDKPTPEPDKPTPEPDTPTPAPKTPLKEEDVFRDDDAGDTWEADPGAITPDTLTTEPEAPAKEEFHTDTGNYEEPAPVSEDAQRAEQETGSQVDPGVQQQQQEAAQQQQAADEAGHAANEQNDTREVRSEEDMARDLADYANDDGTINPDDIPY